MALENKLSVLLKDTNEPILSANITKKRAPIFDIFGPFPDEPLIEAMDRLLYYSGAQRAQKILGLPTPMDECNSSTDCEIVAKCPKSREATCKPKCPAICNKAKKMPTSTSICKEPPCGCRNKPVKPHVDFVKPEKPPLPSISPIGLLGRRLKRSFSLCSLACRRWQCRTPNDFGGQSNGPKWMWTRLMERTNNCQVYQVFENIDMKSHPNSVAHKNTPSVVFVVTASGQVVRFEPLRCH